MDRNSLAQMEMELNETWGYLQESKHLIDQMGFEVVNNVAYIKALGAKHRALATCVCYVRMKLILEEAEWLSLEDGVGDDQED